MAGSTRIEVFPWQRKRWNDIKYRNHRQVFEAALRHLHHLHHFSFNPCALFVYSSRHTTSFSQKSGVERVLLLLHVSQPPFFSMRQTFFFFFVFPNMKRQLLILCRHISIRVERVGGGVGSQVTAHFNNPTRLSTTHPQQQRHGHHPPARAGLPPLPLVQADAQIANDYLISCL